MNEAMSIEAKKEVIRRRAGLGASSAGIGAENANSMSPSNPIATQGGADLMTNPPAPSGGASGSPTDGTMEAAKQQKGEAQKLTDTMIFRLKKLTERGE